MSWFSKKTEPAESKVIGGEVAINAPKLPLEQRLKRAENRIIALEKKLKRLKERPQSDPVWAAIEETEAAIKSWNKVFRLATYEMQLENEK